MKYTLRGYFFYMLKKLYQNINNLKSIWILYICSCVFLCVFISVCAFLWKPEIDIQKLDVFLSHFPLWSLRQGLSQNLKCFNFVRLAREQTQWSSCLFLSITVTGGSLHSTWLLVWVMRIEPRSSQCWHNWSISLVLKIMFKV